jgi:hypothetical protein
MPNFDAGRYFLTVLAPLKSRRRELYADGVSTMTLEQDLALWATALQSPATQETGVNSPFARNRRNHLARFAILDDVVYNGAPPVDPILGRLTGRDPITPQPVDSVAPGYLLFTAEIDAVTEDGAPLPATLSAAEQDAVRDAYARMLWETAGNRLRGVFRHCAGFDDVRDAGGFARYIARAQVETTMPFNDYYTEAPKLPSLPILPLAAAVLAPLAVVALALLGILFGTERLPLLSAFVDWTPRGSLGWAALASVAVAWLAYRFVLARGSRPLPPATDATLPDVLKALYLQRQFARFAERQQGADPAALHAAFGAFLDEHKPDDVDGPTQPPGTIPAPLSAEGAR